MKKIDMTTPAMIVTFFTKASCCHGNCGRLRAVE